MSQIKLLPQNQKRKNNGNALSREGNGIIKLCLVVVN